MTTNIMFRLSLAVLLLAVVSNQLTDGKRLSSTIFNETAYFVHPTFHHASTALGEYNGAIINFPILKTKGAIVVDIPASRHLYKYNETFNPSFKTFRPDAPAETLLPRFVQAPDVAAYNRSGVITYDEERKRARELVELKDDGFLGRSKNGAGCFMYPFRAFELVIDRNNLYGIGVHQGNAVCFITFNTQNVDEARSLEARFVTTDRLMAAPKTYYKIASVWAHPLVDNFAFYLHVLDEAGYYYRYVSNFRDAALRYEGGQNVISMSSLSLEELTQSMFPYIKKDLSAEINKASPDNKGLRIMQAHFEKGFVEAIALIGNSLVYSRANSLARQTPLMAMHRGDVGDLPFPKAWFTEPNHDRAAPAVLALEAYKNGNQYVTHVGLSMMDGQDLIKQEPIWLECSINDPRKAFPNGQWKGPMEDANNSCKEKRFPNGLMPIDIVYIERCRTLYLFYQHVVHEYREGSPTVTMRTINWMNFPVNAILHANNRLYLFNSGNELWITKELNENCAMEDLKMETEYYQSQLLHKFNEALFPSATNYSAYNGNQMKFSEAKPVFDSSRHRFGSNNKWEPPLASINLIPNEYALLRNDRPTSKPTAVPAYTTTPGPKPADSNSNTSIIIVIIIVVIIAAIVLGSIYYFCFGGSDDTPPVVRPKSALRKSKTAPIATTQMPNGEPASSSGATSTAAAPQVVASQQTNTGGIASAVTVRSSMTGSTAPSAASSPTSPTSKIKSKAKSLAKSLAGMKSIRSPGQRPTNATKSKSKSPSQNLTQGTKLKSKASVGAKSMGGHKTVSGHKSQTGSKVHQASNNKTHSGSKKSPSPSPSPAVQAKNVDGSKKSK